MNEFESEVFQHLFSQNRVAFFLDGFDEISPKLNKFAKKLVKATKALTKNLILISTRPSLTKELSDSFDPTIFKFQDLKEDDISTRLYRTKIQKNFIERRRNLSFKV